jgi:hypothetical protein
MTETKDNNTVHDNVNDNGNINVNANVNDKRQTGRDKDNDKDTRPELRVASSAIMGVESHSVSLPFCRTFPDIRK